VTNEKNGRTVRVKVNDRGPFVAGRIVDLSRPPRPRSTRSPTASSRSPSRSFPSGQAGGRGRRRAPGRGRDLLGRPGRAFANAENAERLKARLAARYPSPWLEAYQGLTRVKLGPYRTRDEADAAREGLADFGLAGIVVPHGGDSAVSGQ
jgi:Lipoproteins